jgi:hypothetical protein
VDDFQADRTQLVSETNLAVQWQTLWDRAEQLKALPQGSLAVEAQKVLWQGFTQQTIADAGKLLDQANSAVVAGGGSAVGFRETVPPAQMAALRIARGDFLTELAAFGVAVIVGLNNEYFPKPFGSLSDYARVLAYGLTASIAADLASMALDKVGSSVSGALQKVTRS